MAASPLLPPQSGGCARAAAYDAAARRGLRAPDVAAIAVAKRAYLRQVQRYPLTQQEQLQGLAALLPTVVMCSQNFIARSAVNKCPKLCSYMGMCELTNRLAAGAGAVPDNQQAQERKAASTFQRPQTGRWSQPRRVTNRHTVQHSHQTAA